MNFDTTPKQDFEFACESMATLVASGTENMTVFVSRLKDVLPSIISGFKHQDKVGKLPDLKPINKEQKKFINLISAHSFLETRQIKAYVPEGFNSTFLEATKYLNESVDRCVNFQSKVIQPYTHYLANIVSNKNATKSTDDHGIFNATLEVERDKAYDQYFSLHSNTKDNRRALGQCVERNADWEVLFNELNTINTKMLSIKRDILDNLSKQAEDYLEIIYHKLEKGEMTDVNPEVCKALADDAYQIACELEFISVTHFNLLKLNNSVDATMKEIERVLLK